MPSILSNSGPLSATGVLWSANVSDVGIVDLNVLDNGGGSTITIETAPDNSTWTAFTGGFSVGASGLTAIGGSTITAKGRYQFPVTAKYIRFRVSTYVSGNVIGDVDYSVHTLAKSMQLVSDTLTATGSTLATALALLAFYNRVSTAAASTGVALPNNTFAQGTEIKVRNDGANALSVYPATAAGKINGGSAGAAVSVAAASSRTFVQLSTSDNWLAV